MTIHPYAYPGLKESTKSKQYTTDQIINAVCEVMAVEVDRVVKSKDRHARIIAARHMCWWMIRDNDKLLPPHQRRALSTIAKTFSKDHTSVLGGVKSMQNRIDTDDSFVQLIDLVRETLFSND